MEVLFVHKLHANDVTTCFGHKLVYMMWLEICHIHVLVRLVYMSVSLSSVVIHIYSLYCNVTLSYICVNCHIVGNIVCKVKGKTYINLYFIISTIAALG